jgi:hypothetical protein
MKNKEIESSAGEDNIVIKEHNEGIMLIIRKIHSLGIPVIKCNDVIPKGFMICLTDFHGINKSWITEGSICAYYIEKFDDESAPELLRNKERYIHIYIRIGNSDTWLYIKTVTLIGIPINIYEESLDNYDDEDDDDGHDDIDYERLNRLSTMVAKTKGFNLLRNRDQRINFAKEVLSHIDEEIQEYEYYGIASNAETFYDFGVLPIEAKKLKAEGKSDSEIAKTLGHTKAKIEKALLCDVSENIRKNIEQYEENK